MYAGLKYRPICKNPLIKTHIKYNIMCQSAFKWVHLLSCKFELYIRYK